MPEENHGLKLPSIPKDCYYEDYIAAILNAGGYYLDRSVHRTKGGLNILELDIVATKFESDKAQRVIVEVKSGGWSIRDLFKVKGWLHYLKESNAAFIYQKDPDDKKDENALRTLAQDLGIDLICNQLDNSGKIDNTALFRTFNINLDKVHEGALRAFRYAYDLERVMLDYINSYSKEYIQYQSPKKVYGYFHRLVDESFFINDPVSRLRFLTDISIEHKNIACILDKEVKGRGLLSPEQCGSFENLFEIENPSEMQVRPVDAALYVQMLNRLYVLKNMVEFLVQSPQEESHTQTEAWIEKLNYLQLNNNISYGIENLKKHPHFYLYPYFFQVFFYVYGGFFMKAKETEELERLSLMTGLEKDEIKSALTFWDELFPLPGGGSWMKTINHGGLYYMQFVPVPLRGIGVNYRRYVYATEGVEDSEKLFDNLKKLLTAHCYNDMIHWNNSAYITLSQDRILHQPSIKAANKFDKHLIDAEDYIKAKGVYKSISRLSELASQLQITNFNVDGFMCNITDETYDLYIIKPNNNLVSFPINQVVKTLKLNQGFFRQCFVLGTDEYKQKEEKDSIWFTCTVHRADLEKLKAVVQEADKL